MDASEVNELKEECSQSKLNVSEVVEDFAQNDSTGKSTSTLQNVAVTNNEDALQLCQSLSEDLMKQNNSEDLVKLQTNDSEIPATGDVFKKVDDVPVENSENVIVSNGDNYLNCEQNEVNSEAKERQNEAIIKVYKPLCADYRSDSDNKSVDSESDSSTLSTCSTTDSSSESGDDSDRTHNSNTGKKATNKLHEKNKKDLMILNLPPIEDLRISVPENACVEIGTITNIVDILVVVESYKGTAALDIDTILFLDHGKRTLGKVFDILGPITEPIYTIRFNSQEQINNLNIKKGLKVYFAPKTEHTNFVFLSEVLKHRGTDASWKDNAEAPPEFLDFSDDEEEKLFKSKLTKDSNAAGSEGKEQSNPRKRSFNKIKPTSGVLQPSRFRNPDCSPRMRNFPRNFSSSPRPNVSGFVQAPPFPYNPSVFPLDPRFLPKFSGPPLPFGRLPVVGQNQNFHGSFYQQRMHTFHQPFGPWGTSVFRPLLPLRPPPPPPPPPPSSLPVKKNDRKPAS